MASYLRALELDQLTLPSSPEFFVTMKRVASYGDQLAAQNAMLQVQQGLGGTITKYEWAAYVRALTARLITEWNLSDENGSPLPITAENIDRLRQDDGEFLASEAQKRLKVRPPQEAANFNQPSSDSSAGTQ